MLDVTTRMFPLLILLSASAFSVSGFSALYSDQNPTQGKKFGGYRIVPKTCADLTSNGKAKGVCMFNYECAQRNGQVVGSCMDGFLFGACCKLPPGSVYLPPGVDVPSSSPSTTSLKPIDHNTFSTKPITLHPVGETILLHKNGSVVVDQNDPQEFDLLKKPQEGSPLPEVNTPSYVIDLENHLSSTNVFTKTDDDSSHWVTKHPYNSNTQAMSKTTQSEFNAVTPSMQGTTRHDEENFPSTTDDDTVTKHSTLSMQTHSTTKLPSYVYFTKPGPTKDSNKPVLFTKPISYTSSNQPLKPKPVTSNTFTQSTTEKSYSTHSLPHEDNMLLIPTITNSKPGIEDVTDAVSINHILHLLNDTEPVPEPISTSSPSLSTWVSINGKPEKTGSYPSSYTTSHYYEYEASNEPSVSTTVQHVQGPSFQVTPQVDITPKPHDNTTPEPPPTVIVLGPFNTYSSVKPANTPSYNDNQQKPSQTVTVLSPFQHSTVVTVKPTGSVISVKPPPHSTYNHQPSWTTASPYISVTHPSTGGSQQMTSPVHLITKPPKPYPSIYSSNKPITFTTVKPVQTYISQKPGSYISNKPVLITSSKPGYPQQNRPIFVSTNSVSSLDTSSSKPVQSSYIKPKPSDKYRPTVNTVRPVSVITQSDDEPVVNSSSLLVAFPPVRDPNITLLSQSDKPDLSTSTTAIDEEQSTVNFIEDDTLNDKVHGFVEKIVQSLEGNFVDLENVLLDGQTKPNATLSQKPVKKPSTVSTSSKPSRPTKKPSTKPTTPKPLVSITKPTSVKPDISIYTNRPTTTVLLSTNYKPLDDSENKPTKKPTSPSTLVVYQSSPTSTTTKRPTPTTVVLDNISIVEEQTEASPSKPPSEVNYKKECGVRPLMKNGRIVGGKGATFGEWPWQVLVREATWLGLFTKNKCGGVLITSRYVITAAHCQPGFLASLVAVFGEYDISGELESQRSVSKNVRRVIVHRQYDAATFENDIALLELESPVAFDSHIVPICMPQDTDDFTGRMATVTGWGRLKYGGGVPSVLQEVQVPVIENSVCQEMFHTAGHSKSIISSFLCAGYANGQRDSCEGDSGGPLMVEREDGRWVLAGTVSHGIKCAAPYLPGVYMRTTYYKPWLQTITGVH
ncbi:serine protease filzig [Macrosteles quadrilineatus]|uniref:serine protease filzig n=1 Tax=Macrosteles quadrilineatus TaxID=74068 RepID=UPI0023E20F9D|nr:serine protease filzig [Macrosteles quadrilineatus]